MTLHKRMNSATLVYTQKMHKRRVVVRFSPSHSGVLCFSFDLSVSLHLDTIDVTKGFMISYSGLQLFNMKNALSGWQT